MHNFNEDKCWKPMVQKYRACISLNGNIVDIIDVHDQIVASFTLSIKFGKVALEEMINHSLIVIPVDGDADSFSPFTYDAEKNSVKATITKTNGMSQMFSATLEDLMMATKGGYIGDDAEIRKHDCFCDKDKHETPSCCDHIKFEPEHCHKPNKPLVDPYVTRSELMEESKKRQINDIKIREIIGETKEDSKTIFGNIEMLSSGLKHESDRSRHEDKIHGEKIEKLERDFEILHRTSQTNDCELRKMISKETEVRSDACSELLKLINTLQIEDGSLFGKIDKLNKDHNRDFQVLKSSDRELRGQIEAEQSERFMKDKELFNSIRTEETKRSHAVSEVKSQLEMVKNNAILADEEIKQDMENFAKMVAKNQDLLKHEIKKVEHESDRKYQPKGDYVTLTNNGVVLDGDKGLYIANNKTPLAIAKVDSIGRIELGDANTNLQLTGSGEILTYNGENVALVKDIPSLDGYAKQQSLNEALEAITSLQEEILKLKSDYKALKEEYKILNEKVYQLGLK